MSQTVQIVPNKSKGACQIIEHVLKTIWAYYMKRNFHQLTDTVKCTGLDPAWNKLTTETKFPVNKGTVLTVSCEEGFKLSGSNTVTCTEGTTFSTDTTPTCTQGKREGLSWQLKQSILRIILMMTKMTILEAKMAKMVIQFRHFGL
jgi:hypothetical protein